MAIIYTILVVISLIFGMIALLIYTKEHKISDLVWAIGFIMLSNIWGLSGTEYNHYNKMMQEIKQGTCINE